MSEHATAEAEQAPPTTLTITPEFERAVLERVESGDYESTDHVLAACVQALSIHEDIIHDMPDVHVVELRFARYERSADSGRRSGRGRRPAPD